MDFARLKKQKELAELENQVKLQDIASRNTSRTELSVESERSDSVKRYNMNLGMYSNKAENLEAFVTRFEVVAEAYSLPDRLYAIEFSKSLSGESLQVYETLSSEHRLNYECVIEVMKRRFGITQSSYRKRFLQAKVLPNEM